MSDLRLSFIVNAIDGATAPLKRMTQGIAGIGQRISHAFAPAREMLEGFSRSYEGLALAVGGGFELKEIIGDQDLFNRLRVQYGMTGDAAEDLHRKVMTSAATAGASLDQVKAALSGYGEYGGDVAKFADKLDLVSHIVTLLGGQGEEVGEMIAGLERSFNITGPQELAKTLATLYDQSIKMPGGFQAMAEGLNRTAVLYAALGRTGPQAAREIGAVFAMMAEGTGDAREARSELQQFLQALQDPNGALRRSLPLMGVKLQPSDFISTKLSVSVPDILRQIGKTYMSGPAGQYLVSSKLGPEMLNDLRTLITDLTQTGKTTTLNAKLGVAGDPKKMFGDSARAAQSLTSQLAALRDQLIDFGDENLIGPINALTGALKHFGWLVAGVLTTLGGLFIFSTIAGWIGKTWKAGKFIVELFSKLSPTVLTALRALGGLPRVLASVLLNGGALLEWIAGLLEASPLLAGFFTMLSEGFLAVGVAIEATPIGWLITGLAAVAAGIYEIYEHWEQLKSAFEAFVMPDWLKHLFGIGSVSVAPSAAQTQASLAGLSGGIYITPPAPAGATTRAPAFGGAGKGAANGKADVTVTFENAPKGMRLKKTAADGVNLDVGMGYMMTVPAL